MWLGFPDLPRARIGGEHALEVLGQPDRGLAVAGAAVPGEVSLRGDGCEEGEQLRWVRGAERPIIGGVPGEMILERWPGRAHSPASSSGTVR